MRVSALLLVFNEEANLGRCLEALTWCDDVVAVDSGSTDGSVELLRSFGVRVLHRPFDNFANQRNFGLENGSLRHEWVLHLDADEVVTPEFLSALNALTPADGIDAFRVPSKIMLHEKWLRYAGMFPTYQVRLGHRERLRFKQVGHGQQEDVLRHRIGTFPEPYLHYNFSHGIAAWLRKHIRYAEDEARSIADSDNGFKSRRFHLLSNDATERRRGLKMLSDYLPLAIRPIARFFYVFIWRRGFLDGRYGALYALMLSVYEGMIAILVQDELFRRQHGSNHEDKRPNLDRVRGRGTSR
jgi:glycosyltransferase involved in cell wall biosynthesis